MTKWKYLPKRAQREAQKEPRTEQPLEYLIRTHSPNTTPQKKLPYPNFYTPEALWMN
jgi:hypothetical protein